MFLRDLVFDWVREQYPTDKWHMIYDGAGEDLYAIYREIKGQHPPANYEGRRLKQAMIYVRGNNKIFARTSAEWLWVEVQAADPLSLQKVVSKLESWRECWS